MNSSKETFLKVFGLILISLIPTICIYLLLDEFVGKAQLEGKVLGYTINFAGPLAFYLTILLLFRNWAVTHIPTRSQIIPIQEELEAMPDMEKGLLLDEINGQISSYERQRNYLTSLINNSDITGSSEITQVQVDESNVRQ